MAVQLDRPRTQAPRPAARSLRRRRRWLRAVKAVAAAAVVVMGLLAILVVATPSVSNAPTLVDQILASHSATSDHGVIPARVAAAVLATEDSRFYSDPAVDAQGTLRAAWGLVTRNPNEGGATLEVQLAKLLYTPGRSDPLALAEQVALAFKLDQRYSKTRILAMYLDAAYFGDGAYGVTAAAQHYFGRPAGDLTWGQASLLAGLVQAPSAYNPVHHLSMALLRRSHVLDRLVAVHTLTRAQAQAVEAAPLDPALPFRG